MVLRKLCNHPCLLINDPDFKKKIFEIVPKSTNINTYEYSGKLKALKFILIYFNFLRELFESFGFESKCTNNDSLNSLLSV